MNPFDQFDVPAPANAPPVVPVQATANPFDQFDDHPAASPPAPAASSPKPFADGMGGELPDGSATRDPAVWARWLKDFEPSPAAAQPAAVRTGLGANIGAGLQEGAASTLNVAADPFGNLVGKPLITLGTGAYNLGSRFFGYEPISAKMISDLLDDHGSQIGDRTIAALDHAGGVPSPAEVAPADGLERYARAASQGVAGMAVLSPNGAILGAASGMGGQAASDAAPDDLKPIAGLAGGIAGGAAMAAPVNAVRPIIRPAVNGLMEYAAPAMGRQNALMDVAGAPIMTSGSNPVPVMASGNQARLAGLDIQKAATNPGQVRNVLANPPTGQIGQPTTFQLTRDPGLGQMENGLAKGAGAPAFRQRQDAQNDARVATVRGVADGGDPLAITRALRQTGTDLDAMHTAELERARTGANALVARAESDASAGEVSAARQTAGLQGRAGQTLGAIGGDYPAGSDGTVGAALRAPMDAARQAAKKRESALWDAIDPDGTLGVNMNPVSGKAHEITRGMSPNDDPMAGKEADIFKTARELPDVQSFRDLGVLRSRITTGIRQARGDPKSDPQTVGRLSELLNGVHEAMDVRMQARRADDALAVSSGRMAPDQTMDARIAAQRDAWYAKRNDAAASQSSVGVGDTGRNAADGSSRVPPVAGGRSSSGGQSGHLADNQGLQSAAPLTQNWDQAAAERYAAARAATAENASRFKSAPGVGSALRGGPVSGSFNAPDSTVPNIIVKVGPQGADVAKAYLAAGGTTQALTDAAAFSLRQEAMRDGVLDPVKAAGWMQKRASFLSQIPDAAARFGAATDAARALKDGVTAPTSTVAAATKLATQTINDATARRAAALKEYQDSVAGGFLGGADPVAQVGMILRSRTGEADMAHLAKLTANDPDARAGLQRAVVEHILRDISGDAKGASSTNGYLYGAQVQKLLRVREPALRQVLTPDQMGSLQKVAESLEASQLSASGTYVGVGSPTVQNASAAMAAQHNTFMGMFTHKLLMAGATGGGAIIGSILGGPVGAGAGLATGAAGLAFQAMRDAGIANIQDLKVQAALNPALARVLLAKATPKNQESLTRAFVNQLGRISLVASQRRDEPSEPPPISRRNALFH